MVDLAQYAGYRIKQLRSENKMTQTELARRLKIGKSAISNYEAGYRMPKQDLLFALSNVFDVDVDFFFPSEEKQSASTTLSLINDTSAKLTENRQKVVLATAEQELAEQNIRGQVTSLNDYKAHKANLAVSMEEFHKEPVIDVNVNGVAAAGFGIRNYCKDRILKVITMKESDIPRSYDLAFEISGNSMSPVYEDGEIVFVRYDSNVYDRSIMVVEINEEVFLKKLFVEGNQLRLVSLNDEVDKNGNPLFPDQYAGEDDEIYIIGKVVN